MIPQVLEWSRERFNHGKAALFLAFAMVSVAAFLPWVTMGVGGEQTISQTGTSGDGLITLLFALTGLGFTFLGRGRRSNLVVVFVAAVTLTLSYHDIRDRDIGEFLPHETLDLLREQAAITSHAAIGLYLSVMGSAAALVIAVLRSWSAEPEGRAAWWSRWL